MMTLRGGNSNRMTERFVDDTLEYRQYSDYRSRVHDYFFSHVNSEEECKYYESRDLTFTNNLHLWFVDDPEHEIASGFPNPYDYRQRPFGPVLDAFRREHPDLWREVQQVMQTKRLDLAIYAKLLTQENITPEILEEYEQKQKDYSANLREQAAITKSRAFDILAPQLLDVGIDPLDLCK